jgi:murein DD-endopeptidase MepM/ murein hydrolase activator NlpD
MLSSKRTRAAGVLGPIARISVIAFTVSAAGCSAEVTRFDFGSKNTTSSIPVPPEPVRNGYGPANAPRGLGLTEAPLPPSDLPGNNRFAGRQYDDPPPAAPLAERRPPSDPSTYRVVGRQYKGPPSGPPRYEPPPQLAPDARTAFHQPPPNANGDAIEVQQGETLYGISRRTGVPVAAIKDANGLSSDAVRPGQRLVMPAGAQDRGPFARTVSAPTPLPPTPDRSASVKQAPPSGPAGESPPGWEGRYTMRNGDSLHGIAIRHRVTVDELMRANGITDPTKVWAGAVLNVPPQPDAAAAPMPPPGTAPRVIQTPTTRVINAAPDQKIASRSDVTTDAEPAAPETTSGKFLWPVRGKTIAGFGRRPDGTHNDGVNVAVPQGTAIHAAESGKVAYAGNEIKGYGNLVLIRHPNGWVTAYAHADQLLVRPNDEVRRGQVIAKAGRTGAVDQPQVHFELRQGSRPVDPMPHLAN